MARGRDPLEEQKIGAEGEVMVEEDAKKTASRLIADARADLPKGVPASSPYVPYGKDQLISDANRLGISCGALLSLEDLRLVCEHARTKIARAGAPTARPAQAAVPEQRVVPVKIRGIKESPTNTWRVVETREPNRIPTVSFGNGQLSKLGNGAVLELRHYDRRTLQSIVDQGIKLIPIEEADPED